MRKRDVIIVGGGLAGIMAAKTLKEQGVSDVLIIEKNEAIGGRLITPVISGGKVDIGSQYFTAFTNLFQTYAVAWQKNGWIKKWFGGKHTRYLSVEGMGQLAENLAEGIDTEVQTKVLSISENEQGFVVTTDKGLLESKALILTPPSTLSLEIIAASDVIINETVKNELEAIVFDPCIVAIVELSEPSKLDALGYADSKLPEGMERMVDHFKKGISTIPFLTLHMTSEWSKDNFDKSDDEILANITEKLTEKYIKDKGSIKSTVLKKWRYSEAIKVVHQSYLNAGTSHPFLFAGDAFLSTDDPSKRARFESAALSGIAAGKEMAKLINES